MVKGLCIHCSPAEETGALHKCCHVCRPVQSPFYWALRQCLGKIRGMEGMLLGRSARGLGGCEDRGMLLDVSDKF